MEDLNNIKVFDTNPLWPLIENKLKLYIGLRTLIRLNESFLKPYKGTDIDVKEMTKVPLPNKKFRKTIPYYHHKRRF